MSSVDLIDIPSWLFVLLSLLLLFIVSFSFYKIIKKSNTSATSVDTQPKNIYVIYALNTDSPIELYGALENIIRHKKTLNFVIVYGNRLPQRFVYAFQEYQHVELIHTDVNAPVQLFALNQIVQRQTSLLLFRNPQHKITTSQLKSIHYFLTNTPETLLLYQDADIGDYFTIKPWQMSLSALDDIMSQYKSLESKTIINNRHIVLIHHIKSLCKESIITLVPSGDAMANATTPTLEWDNLNLSHIQYYCPYARAHFLELNTKLV